MRYRIKLNLVVRKDGKTFNFEKYFRSTSIAATSRRLNKYLKSFTDEGYELATVVSVGYWVD